MSIKQRERERQAQIARNERQRATACMAIIVALLALALSGCSAPKVGPFPHTASVLSELKSSTENYQRQQQFEKASDAITNFSRQADGGDIKGALLELDRAITELQNRIFEATNNAPPMPPKPQAAPEQAPENSGRGQSVITWYDWGYTWTNPVWHTSGINSNAVTWDGIMLLAYNAIATTTATGNHCMADLESSADLRQWQPAATIQTVLSFAQSPAVRYVWVDARNGNRFYRTVYP